jgi:hypothetical protein
MLRGAASLVLFCGLLISDSAAPSDNRASEFAVQFSASGLPAGTPLHCKARLLPAIPGAAQLSIEPVMGKPVAEGSNALCTVVIPYAYSVRGGPTRAQLAYEVEAFPDGLGTTSWLPKREARQTEVTLPGSDGAAILHVNLAF